MTFLDPEVASIGMTKRDCTEKYGVNGFKYIIVDENGTDRADIDSIKRSTVGFIEMRVSFVRGKILGATVYLSNVSDIINEIALASYG